MDCSPDSSSSARWSLLSKLLPVYPDRAPLGTFGTSWWLLLLGRRSWSRTVYPKIWCPRKSETRSAWIFSRWKSWKGELCFFNDLICQLTILQPWSRQLFCSPYWCCIWKFLERVLLWWEGWIFPMLLSWGQLWTYATCTSLGISQNLEMSDGSITICTWKFILSDFISLKEVTGLSELPKHI